MRTTFLPFALPEITTAEFDAVREVLESGWLTTGYKTKQFEAEFAQTVGVEHAVAVNSCTAAMHLALDAIGLQRGDEVITTPYTFAATAEVIRYFDARPVFVDVDPRTFNLRPELLEAAISERTRAIMPVHIAGLAADLDGIHAVAKQYGLPVIEDAAHSFPATYKGRPIGGLSEFTCFSFYATKTITTAEGGMLCTNDAAAAERCRIMALHGISRDAWKRYSAGGSWYYEISAPGYKYNLTDMASALGIAQLQRAEAMRQRREKIAQMYTSAFAEFEALQMPASCTCSQHSWHLYMLRLNLDQLRIGRDEFIEALKQQNIGVSVHFIPLHLHPYYRDLYGYKPQDFPVALREYEREVSLPIYSRMSDEEVEDVIMAVVNIVEANRR